jgi:KaiC domain protein
VSDEDDDWFEGGFDEDDPFDEGGAGGPGDAGDSEELFEEDFAAAFEGGGGGADFDEEFESEIPRIDLGIEGLDEMIQGGVPERALLVVIGAAGTGKTTFGIQFLQQGLERGERTVYITLEESRESIVEAATEKGWPFDEYLEEDRLAIVDLDPVEMANSLASIRGDLPRLIDEFEAERLVLDSVSLLEMMYDNQPDRRTEVFDFTKALKRAGVTTMVTSEADQDNPYASRHGIIEYLTDGVFALQYVRSEFRETRLAVEIQKIRNANHSRETKPYEITGEGISVYQQANIF